MLGFFGSWAWISLAPVTGWRWRLDGRPVKLEQGPGIIQYLELSAGDQTPYKIIPGAYVKLAIMDTGVGMDEATRKRIFEPFFTTKEMGRGSGLGLASAYGIIKNHGGYINVYSEMGRGTTFNLYLPACDHRQAEDDGASRRIYTGSETILLVDDEADFAEELYVGRATVSTPASLRITESSMLSAGE